MTSGKGRGGKKRSQKKRRDEDRQEAAPLIPLGDPRAVEKVSQDLGRILSEREFGSIEEANAFLKDMLGEGGGQLPPAPAPTTPLERAQDLVYEAFETESSRKRVQLAKKALKVSPDCADAYVLLAEESARSLQEAKDLYEKGVQAGERALGKETFEEEAGHFWDILETRPYMRARQGLAVCLWELGEHEEAIEHCREMLDLNPNDNQGIRYELAGWLLDEEMDQELGELLERYEEDASAFWVYTTALWTFRKEGDTEEATAALEEAIETNPYVPLYLLGRKSLPGALPELMGFGDESEAVAYFASALPAWLRTPQALEWLRQNVDESTLADLEEE